MKTSASIAFLAAAAVGNCARTFDKSNITLSAVVAAPAGWPMPVANKNWIDGYFNLDETVDYGVKLIHEARDKGADLIGFPELWFPG